MYVKGTFNFISMFLDISSIIYSGDVDLRYLTTAFTLKCTLLVTFVHNKLNKLTGLKQHFLLCSPSLKKFSILYRVRQR